MFDPKMDGPLKDAGRNVYRLSENGSTGVNLLGRDLFGHFNLRGSVSDSRFAAAIKTAGITLPIVPNTVVEQKDIAVFWLSPDEWLLTCPETEIISLSSKLETIIGTCFASFNDISGGQISLKLSGPNALDVLAKGCTLDLHAQAFSPGQCAQTNVAKATVLVRPLISNHTEFEIIVRRSFAEYLWEWLCKASAEYGYTLN